MDRENAIVSETSGRERLILSAFSQMRTFRNKTSGHNRKERKSEKQMKKGACTCEERWVLTGSVQSLNGIPEIHTLLYGI